MSLVLWMGTARAATEVARPRGACRLHQDLHDRSFTADSAEALLATMSNSVALQGRAEVSACPGGGQGPLEYLVEEPRRVKLCLGTLCCVTSVASRGNGLQACSRCIAVLVILTRVPESPSNSCSLLCDRAGGLTVGASLQA